MTKIKPGTYKVIAKSVIINHLGSGMNAASMNAIYEIRRGNDEELLKHIKALKNIFEEAIKEIEGEMKDGRKI